MRIKTEEDLAQRCGCREASCPHSLAAAFGPRVSRRAQIHALRVLVHNFSNRMLEKLIAKLDAGRAGWDDESWTVEQIIAALRDHIDKGDPVDIANFAAFWWNRLPETRPATEHDHARDASTSEDG